MSDFAKKTLHLIIDAVFMGILIFADQFTKQLAIENLKDKPALNIIENVFELNYLENRGAAFGLFQNQKAVFVVIAAVMLILVCFLLYRLPLMKKYLILEIALVMIGAGAIGNMIDRVANDYVVDFFYFVLINFPIFNVADIYVTVSCVILLIMFLWVYKEEDLEFLSKGLKTKPKKEEA